MAADLLPLDPQPGLIFQLTGPDNGGPQPDIRLIRIDQLQRLLPRIHVLPWLDEVLVHHTIEGGEDVGPLQLRLDLAHLYPCQLLGQFGLLHVVTRLVVLALGGALLLVQSFEPLELGAGVAQVACFSGLFCP
ncbi:hypothetical protein D3C81_505860 [compost metagenome]